MCQATIEGLSNRFESCQVQKVASLLTEALREVSADKAYLSRQNMELVEGFSGTPFIPFKSNTVVPKGDSVWTKMYHLFMFNRDSFMAHYHKRSNVESAFSMIKRKFGASVRGKSDVAQVNEVLAKVLCHNICVLILAARELGIETVFYPQRCDPK